MGMSRVTGFETSAWRSENVPLPRSHLLGIVIGLSLEGVRRWKIPISRRTAGVLGSIALSLNVALLTWAVSALGRVDSRIPEQLVAHGPYRFSRNPMYVGWTGLYLGLAVLRRSGWMLLFAPCIAGVVHVTVRREEAELERAFGQSYHAYRDRVARCV